MKISDISIKRPVFATMMILALLVLGASSYLEMPVELFPKVEFPFVVVQTVYPGASAETVETEVTKEVEEVINEISGVRHIQSESREGFSLILVEFELEIDADIAAQDVREKVAGVRGELPDDIEEPIVSQWDPEAEPIMSVAISGRRPQREITQITEDIIVTRLEAVNGVGSVDIIGGHDREILVAVNLDRLESYQLSIDDVNAAIQTANLEIPGGRVTESSREYLVRVMGKLRSVGEFKDIIVKNQDGTPIYLSDVAHVVDTIAEIRSLSSYNGKSAVGLNVVRQSGANVVDLAEDVRKTLQRLADELPPDMNVTIVNDQSVWIEDAIHEILFNIRIGTLLAVFVIFMFLLDLRPTIITGLSIPISIVATFTVMNFLGFTINFMTLLGLSLAVGILIDDSIVVVENVYRHIQEGKSPRKAAFSGTSEIGLAVMATTFSIVVVFLPVAFMEGIVGRFFYQFGVTVAAAVLISLFVAFTLVPMLTARTEAPEEDESKLDPKKATGWRKVWYSVRKRLMFWNRAFDAIKPRYERLLEMALNHRILTMVMATLAFALGIYVASQLPQEWMPPSDEGKIWINVETPPGTTLQETDERLEQIVDLARENVSEIQNTYYTIGAGNNEVTQSTLLLLLTDAQSRDISSVQLVDSLRKVLQVVPGVNLALASQQAEGGSSKPIELSIRGENRDELTRITHELQRIMQRIPGTVDVDNTLEEGKPELQIEIDRKAADDLGLNLATISQTLRNLIEGEVVTTYKEGDEEHDVRVRLQERFRESDQDVGRALIASGKDIPGTELLLVPLDRVGKIEKEEEIGEYRRYDRQPEVRVNANAKAGYATGTIAQTALAVADTAIQLPAGYSIGAVGEEEIREESSFNILKALILAIIFIYLVLASQYESFSDPFSIMLSLPLSLIGAVLGLEIFGSSMNLVAQIGIVMLMGLVTKNAILLIDFVKQERQKGVDRRKAILTAGPIRLRPILMTTFATVFGMLPLAFELGPGAEMRAPMARAVIGGMISSTLLTLIVVPVVYTLIDDFVGLFRRGKKSQQERDQAKSEEYVLDS